MDFDKEIFTKIPLTLAQIKGNNRSYFVLSKEQTMAASQPAVRSSQPHIHISGLQCPVCDQPIPSEKADQVRARMEARERDLSDSLRAKLKEQFAKERMQIEANARAVLERLQKDNTVAIEAVKREALQKEVAAREEGSRVAQAAAEERIAQAERDRITALRQYEALHTNHEAIVGQRISEAREALDKAKTEAVNALKAEHFNEKQKLTGKLEELTRQIEKKSADERGEGAEVNLFEALKEEFPRDSIKRVGKGSQGADVIHEVIHNNKVCGRIVYDCKDRNAWRNDYVTKLHEDKTAAKAEHAILSSRVFPAGARQLCEQSGVLIANPARVIALVQMLRRHIVQLSTLRLSNEKRAQKTATLYEFIRSDRCTQLFERIDRHADDLLKLQEKEKKEHDALWKRQGTLYRGVQKACGDLCSEIDRIIEAAD